MSEVLSDAEIEQRLPSGWDREGSEIVRTYEFDDYLTAAAFVGDLATLADEAFHHPEITLGFREVSVRLTTHDAGGITQADIDLAAAFEATR